MSTTTVLAVAPSPRRGPRPAGAAIASRPLARPAERAASAPRPPCDADRLARRALDVGRRTALGVLAGDAAAADDVAQEVAIAALRHAHRLRDPEALDGWLHRTAVRAALRSVRRGRRRRQLEAEHVASLPPSADADAVAVDELGALLAPLPERQRAALTLRYAHDLDDDAIAAALGCRAGTVRALLSRGRQAVRARLAIPDAAGATPTDGDAAPSARSTPSDGDAPIPARPAPPEATTTTNPEDHDA